MRRDWYYFNQNIKAMMWNLNHKFVKNNVV